MQVSCLGGSSNFSDGPSRRTRGAVDERIAADLLRRERGFAGVARNWRSVRDRRAEIDLACREGEALVFVEVKTRATGAMVSGYDSVTPRKKRALCRAYLALLPRRPRTFRFDVVEIELLAEGAPQDARPAVRHSENIPLFSKNSRRVTGLG